MSAKSGSWFGEVSPRISLRFMRATGYNPTMIRVLDPTNEMKAVGVTAAPRSASLAGKIVGFISNGKEGTKAYFAHVERLLRAELGVREVVWRTKSNYSAPADKHIVDEISRWHAVVTGVGD